MKKPIKTSHVIALLSFVMFPLVLTFFNFTKIHKVSHYFPQNKDQVQQPLSGKIITRTTYFDPLEVLSIDLKFVDTVLLLPSKRDYVTIHGDSVLLNNIKVVDKREKSIYLRHKWWYANMNEPEHLSVRGPKNTNVKIIIGYTALKSLNIHQPLKAFIQKGVLKGENIHIAVVSDMATLNVEADYLDLILLKPDHLPIGETISTSQMKNSIQNLKRSPMHQIKGKADLVRLINDSDQHLYLDLDKLQCRQVLVELNTTSYNKIIANPSQLLSSILSYSKGHVIPKNEIICQSKAKVVHAFRAGNGLFRYN